MKSKRKTPHRRRQELVRKLLEVPKSNKNDFWKIQMKLLKILEDRYSLEFLEVMTFPKKYESLSYFVSEELKETMDAKWRNFNFKVDLSKYNTYVIGEKSGKDYQQKYNKPKNTKELFNE
jgi:hypothetical protein